MLSMQSMLVFSSLGMLAVLQQLKPLSKCKALQSREFNGPERGTQLLPLPTDLHGKQVGPCRPSPMRDAQLLHGRIGMVAFPP